MSWLNEYYVAAAQSDKLTGEVDHLTLLLTGLVGEAGGVLVEFKKRVREGAAYPHDRSKLTEELGDALWYFTRVVHVCIPSSIVTLEKMLAAPLPSSRGEMQTAISFSSATVELLKVVQGRDSSRLDSCIRSVWRSMLVVAASANLQMKDVAEKNDKKRQSRWPTEQRYVDLFDKSFPEEDRLPRRLDVEFRQLNSGDRRVVVLRCNGLNLGDRLTDNIQGGDYYRFHDIFHFAHAVYLGWSPVLRDLLKCKRKSNPDTDENQDGARARIVEEAVSATIFNRAKNVRYFRDVDHVDYDLLKAIEGLVRGFEVEVVPLWQWEKAILKGYEVFEQLKDHERGKVSLDLEAHELCYLPR